MSINILKIRYGVMCMKVSIVGATGYSGLELIRILHNHPNFDIVSIHNYSNIGIEITTLFPHLKSIYSGILEEVIPERIMAQADCVFFATPAGVSSTAAIPFMKAGFPVIDLSGDFRLGAESYEKWYNKAPADAVYLEKMVYGLAEFRQNLTAKWVANPGCYATSVLLPLLPLISEVKLSSPIVIDAKSGASGAGKVPSEANHFVHVHDNLSVYKLNEHQHIPEIMRILKQRNQLSPKIQFSTSLLPVARGILSTIYLALDEVEARRCEAILQTTFAQKKFVRIQPLGKLPNIKHVIGSNFCDIGLAYNTETGILTVVSVLDNLVKGASGQAVQNLNLMFGLEESTGLLHSPIFP